MNELNCLLQMYCHTPQKSWPCRHYGGVGPEHILKVPHESSLNEQVYLTKYRKGYTRHIFLCIHPARPPERGFKILAVSNIGGTT